MDVLENYEKDTIRIGVKIVNTSTRAIAAVVLWLLGKLKEQLFDKDAKGLVSIKKLTKDGYTLSSEMVKDPNLKQLAKIMKKYNIGFSAMQQGDSKNYLLFFKAKDKAQLSAALEAYLAKTVKRNHSGKDSPDHDGPDRDDYDRHDGPDNRDNHEGPYNWGSQDSHDTPGNPKQEKQKKPETRNMSFDAQALTEEAKEPSKAVEPKPRSISKALEKAKNEARALEQAREITKEMTRQRFRGKEKTR